MKQIGKMRSNVGVETTCWICWYNNIIYCLINQLVYIIQFSKVLIRFFCVKINKKINTFNTEFCLYFLLHLQQLQKLQNYLLIIFYLQKKMSRKNHLLTKITPKQSQNYPLHHSNSSREQSLQSIPINIRVVQTNLVYAIGLPPSICLPHLLETKSYFGKFGKVIKIVINKQTTSNQKQYKNPSHSAYITYENDVSAALAVIGLFQFKFEDKIIRCCFGTSKYCQIYFRGGNCRRDGCVFLHKRNKSRQINLGEGKTIKQNERQCFQKQLKLALQTTFSNYKQIIKKYKHQQQDNQKSCASIFPNVYHIMKMLVYEKYLDSDEYEAQWQDFNEPLLKTCHSQSTQSSPTKEIQQYEQNNCNNTQKMQQDVVVEKNNKQQQQSISNTLEEVINKSIIMRLFSKDKYRHSHFKFGRGNKLDENIKFYVQRLIVNEGMF